MTPTPEHSEFPHHGFWRKSSRSGGQGGDCVEIRPCDCHGVAIRDSKTAPGPVLRVAEPEWRSLVSMLKQDFSR